VLALQTGRFKSAVDANSNFRRGKRPPEALRWIKAHPQRPGDCPAEAEFAKGVLTVALPTSTAAQRQQKIEVKAARAVGQSQEERK
jgi:HSP20 family molecular chaperone IbpA